MIFFQAHPNDAELLNSPIENYQQMKVIFGNGFATGKFAMGSSEPLGTPSDFATGKFDLAENLLGQALLSLDSLMSGSFVHLTNTAFFCVWRMIVYYPLLLTTCAVDLTLHSFV
jgi:hypothetical protein